MVRSKHSWYYLTIYRAEVTLSTNEFNIHRFYVLHMKVFVCSTSILERTAIISLYSI